MHKIIRATALIGCPFLNNIVSNTANRNKKTRYSEEYLVFILVEDEGFELRFSFAYGVFETFVFIKHRFCFIYLNISNCSFYTNPLKGNLKGKNMGKQNCK